MASPLVSIISFQSINHFISPVVPFIFMGDSRFLQFYR
jgi:hypothetical protein